MQRPRRQAASQAMEKMLRIREWEELPENSKRFRECAKQIEQEFRSEVKQRHVRTEDLDMQEDSSTEESEDDYETANESFVSDDCSSGDGEYVPPEDEEEVQEALDDVDASDGASEQESVPEESNTVESEAASIAETEEYDETVSGDASTDASLASTEAQ
jgi:hypothetical protein